MNSSINVKAESVHTTMFTSTKRLSQVSCNSNICCKNKIPNSFFAPKSLSLSPFTLKNLELKRVCENRQVIELASSGNESDGLTYKDEGVDIDAGSELVKRIAKMAPGIGGFGGLYPFGILIVPFI